MELINREDVRREIQYSFDLGAFAWRDGQYLMDRINALPTIDAVPVVHGEWIDMKLGDELMPTICKCSVCGATWAGVGGYIYCPNCGARMDMDYREPPKEVQE